MHSHVRVFPAKNLAALQKWHILNARSGDVLDLWGIVLRLEPMAFILLSDVLVLVMVLVIHV